MAIVFQVDKSGTPSPEITCDGCGSVINDHTQGVAILGSSHPESGEALEPIFLCKGCEEKTEKANVQRRKMPIDRFLLGVLNNLQLTPYDLEAVGRKLMKDANYW